MAPQENSKESIDGVATKKLTDFSVQVDDKLYDTASLAAVHPGGELFVKAFSGRDATEAFLSYHRREFPHSKMAKLQIGETTAAKDPKHDADYLELCKIVEQVLPRNKSFAPLSYYIKIAVLLSVSVGLEMYMHLTGNYVWYLTGLLGWLFALIGLNVQHDANHGAISRNPLINRTLGLFQNWIGGSAVDWIHQHVVQHHINPNDVHHDPDIVGNQLLRLNPLSSKESWHMTQYIYMFFLLTLFGFTYIVDSFTHNLEGFHKIHYSKLLSMNRVFEQGTIIFFAFRWFVLPMISNFSIYTVLNIIPLFIVGGFYLSFFFVISHNFEGVHLNESTDPKVKSFLMKQAVTSSNVGGSFLCFLNGGLNYQIEHHLFPRIQHTHYPTIAPFVRTFCEAKNIPYRHFPTVWDNVLSCSRHLYQLGNNDYPVGYTPMEKK